MEDFRSKHIETFLRMKNSTSLHLIVQSSMNTLLDTGKRKDIAIDPSYIPKSVHKTPWIGHFWSGCAGEYKRGLEIMGIGVIDIDNHECMTLGSIQTPDSMTLDSEGKNLVDWYSCYFIKCKDLLQKILNWNFAL